MDFCKSFICRFSSRRGFLFPFLDKVNRKGEADSAAVETGSALSTSDGFASFSPPASSVPLASASPSFTFFPPRRGIVCLAENTSGSPLSGSGRVITYMQSTSNDTPFHSLVSFEILWSASSFNRYVRAWEKMIKIVTRVSDWPTVIWGTKRRMVRLCGLQAGNCFCSLFWSSSMMPSTCLCGVSGELGEKYLPKFGVLNIGWTGSHLWTRQTKGRKS